MNVEDAGRLKEVEQKNTQLKPLLADARPGIEIDFGVKRWPVTCAYEAFSSFGTLVIDRVASPFIRSLPFAVG